MHTPAFFKGTFLDILAIVFAGLPNNSEEYKMLFDYFFDGLDKGRWADSLGGFMKAEMAFARHTEVSPLELSDGVIQIRSLTPEETLKRKAWGLFEVGCSNVLREFHGFPKMNWFSETELG